MIQTNISNNICIEYINISFYLFHFLLPYYAISDFVKVLMYNKILIVWSLYVNTIWCFASCFFLLLSTLQISWIIWCYIIEILKALIHLFTKYFNEINERIKWKSTLSCYNYKHTKSVKMPKIIIINTSIMQSKNSCHYNHNYQFVIFINISLALNFYKSTWANIFVVDFFILKYNNTNAIHIGYGNISLKFQIK